MLTGGIIVVASFAYVGLLFAVAAYGDKRADAGRSLIANPYIYALSLAVYCTSWTFYGSVGRAAGSGIGFLPIYLGPTLMVVGTAQRLNIAKLEMATGAKFLIVPFKGTSESQSALLGGHVDVLVLLPGAIAGQLKAGTVRILTAVSAQRDALLPDVPTAQELGHKVALDAWRGITVPKGTPRTVIAMLENAIRQTVLSAEFAGGSEKLYVKPAFLPAADFGKLIAQEDAELAKLMQLIGLKK